ncbi:hypothetical protein RJ641_035601 [Dillenia turbinata]|uniref:Uncharacterized protein n=1 Tax=Dillenia turbinata TaxID=194707 RepID=A0AAN8ZEU0_9MAGN
MKCKSVACIWSASPPLHRITATAVINAPPTLYTGASDGSIIWWHLSGDEPKKEFMPVALLCGHAAPIVDLDTCTPVVSGEGKNEVSSNVVENCSSDVSCALISACNDGVLCVWSRGSGHCRCRRKMPPWVGSPSRIQALPTNKRYVCIASGFIDSVHFVEGGKATEDHDFLSGKPSKHSIIVVDTYTLTIVQTIFHGNSPMGPLSFMDLVLCREDEKEYVLMVNLHGKSQLVPVLKDPNPEREGGSGSGLHKSCSNAVMSIWSDEISEGEQVVSIATCEKFIAFVYRSRCVFRLLIGITAIGEISFADNLLCAEGCSTDLRVAGGMFIKCDFSRHMMDSNGLPDVFVENFAAWNNRGLAIVYAISWMDNNFKFDPLCKIPALSPSVDVRCSISFTQLSSHLLRIESHCICNEEPLLWKPNITMWSMCGQGNDHGKLSQTCQMIGSGGFSMENIAESKGFLNDVNMQSTIGEVIPEKSLIPSPKAVNGFCLNDKRHGFCPNRQIVSCSMIISRNSTPYAVVYGFHSGEIEMVKFEVIFQEFNFHLGHSQHSSKQLFLGHRGAVLCLAAHWMELAFQERSFRWILVSGSTDCTVCLWDLDTSNLIMVMHQHVSPVRQIVLPPSLTARPWSDCFLSVGEDGCVALASFETLRVERMFPGHPSYPSKVLWDGARGYIACLCQYHSGRSEALDVLYIWDIKTGARERVLRGTASQAMFDHFCKGVSKSSISGTTSASSLHASMVENGTVSHLHSKAVSNGLTVANSANRVKNATQASTSQEIMTNGHMPNLFRNSSGFQNKMSPIKCSCPFPEVATLSFDLASLMSPEKLKEFPVSDERENIGAKVNENGTDELTPHPVDKADGSDMQGELVKFIEKHDQLGSEEGCLLRFSLSYLHLWEVDCELDELLVTDMKLVKPEAFNVASGLEGDRGSLTVAFPGLGATELWKLSSEFCAMRSLALLSIAQRIVSLSHSTAAASSALAAFYTRNLGEKIPEIKPPSLQLLVTFWQNESEHVRLAARSLFHCAASRAIPLPLYHQNTTDELGNASSRNKVGEIRNENLSTNKMSTTISDLNGLPQVEEYEICTWLEPFEVQDWISCVGGTSQDAMASHIVVAAALAVWYPSLVKPVLAALTVHPLVKLVMAMNETYSSTAAELLAEGMDSTWKAYIGTDIPRLIGDIFFQIECVSGSSNSAAQNHYVPVTIRETLVDILLPSLAIADVPGFLSVIESQIWSTASDSPVHLVSLMTLIRVVRGSPRSLVQHLDKVVNFILQTLDHSNLVMRKTCLHSSLTALKEISRVLPMVALNDTSTRLAIGDAIADINIASIHVYDLESVTKMKILDASGPPGLPSFLAGSSQTTLVTAISALCFSPNGEGIVAFSEHGLMIRWWSLGSAWWEKLSRNFVPFQCTKLIFVPPWEGFSPNSSRSSVMARIMGQEIGSTSQVGTGGAGDADSPKALVHNLDLSYRLEWVSERKLLLTRHGQELGSFQL